MDKSCVWKALLIPGVLIVIVTLWIYSPVLRGEWLWDDKELISQNAVMHDPHGLWRIWTDPGCMVDYYPVLSSMEWIEWHLFHQWTFGYHFINVFLHVAGAFLVWRLLDKLGLRLAWVGGLFFAIHPVQVESVAWMAELKNTLSLPLFLLSMCAYIDFDEHGRMRDYFLSLGFFVLAMFCKTTMVMFPVVILLYAWWKRGRIRLGELKASPAFFGVSLVLGVVTLWFQQQHAINGLSIVVGDSTSRLALAGTSASFYFLKTLWPGELVPIYPKWTVDPPTPIQFLPWVVLLAVVIFSWVKRATWGRHVLLGLGFFFINLLPFVGFTTTYYMSFSWVVDHVLYLPLIGLIGLVTGAASRVYQNHSVLIRQASVALITGGAALMAIESHGYAGKFINQHTLWTYTLQRNPDAWPAHINLGNYLYSVGCTGEAIKHLKEAIHLNPQIAAAYNDLGNGYQKLGQYSEAIEQYKIALTINPEYEAAHQDMGLALVHLGKPLEAIEQYERALQLDPNDTATRLNLADLLLQAGRANEAAEQYDQALRGDPHYPGYLEALKKVRTKH